MRSVYLAGPITNLTYAGSTEWRDYVSNKLEGIECYSPLRFECYLDTEEKIRDNYDNVVETPLPLSTSKGIMSRDYFDCMRADIIFVNLLGLERVSIGTCMEIAWGYTTHKPIIAVMEPENNMMDHAMWREAIGFRVETLDQGIDIIKAILLT